MSKAPKQQTAAAKTDKRQPFLQRKPTGAADRPFISPQHNPVIQPKLTVNKPGDAYEQEADRMAEQVMRMPVENAAPPMISRMHAGAPVQRKCATCAAEKESGPKASEGIIQRKCEPKMENGCGSDVQRSATDADLTHAPDKVTQRLVQRKGRGSPLPPAINDHMGQAFQSDFNDVRLHTDPEAAAMSSDLNAQAFTYGQDVYFNAGKYQPGTVAGRGLLGHELTHTVQQGGGGIKKQPADTADVLQVSEPEQVIYDFTNSTYGYLQYNRKELWEALKPYYDPKTGTSSIEQVELQEELTAVETEMQRRIGNLEADISVCSTDKFDHLTYDELVERKNILYDLRLGKSFLFTFLNNHQGFASALPEDQINQNFTAISSEITSRNKAANLPVSFTTCQDFSTWDFLYIFNDYRDAVHYLKTYSDKAEVQAHQQIVRRLRDLMDEKIRKEIPPELLIKDFSKDEEYVKSLSEEEVTKFIYAIETYLGNPEVLKNSAISKYFTSSFFNYKLDIVLQNLQLLQGVKGEKGMPYHWLVGEELMEDPDSGEALAIDPVGLRHQILSMYRQDYVHGTTWDALIIGDDLINADQKRINQFIGSSIELIDQVLSNRQPGTDAAGKFNKIASAEPYPLFDTQPIFDTAEQSVNIRIYKLKQDIRKGKHPAGVDPAQLISMIDQQYKIIQYERESFLAKFEEKAKEVTNKILDNSERKINQEKVKYGLQTRYSYTIKGGSIARISHYKLTNTAELAGLSHAANMLAKKGKEVKALKDDLEMFNLSQTLNKPDAMVDDMAYTLVNTISKAVDGGADSKIYHDYQVGLRIKQNDIDLYRQNNLEQTKIKEKEYNQLREAYEVDYPILASWATHNNYDTLEKLDYLRMAEMAQILGADMDAKLANIAEVRSELGKDISIWEMYEIMDLTRQVMNIPDGSIYTVWVDDKSEKVREDKDFWDTFLDVLALGLGILAIPFTGGASLVLVGASLAIQGYRIMDKLNRYQLEMAMYGTDFDPANALIHEEPSLDWLVWDLVGLGFDAADLVKGLKVAFNGVKGSAKQFISAPSEATKKVFLEAAQKVGTETGKDLVPALSARADEIMPVITARAAAREVRNEICNNVDSLFGVSLKNGHHLRLTKSGQLVICSDCRILRTFFAEELTEHSDLLRDLVILEDAVTAGHGKLTVEAFEAAIGERTRTLIEELQLTRLARESAMDKKLLKEIAEEGGRSVREFLKLIPVGAKYDDLTKLLIKSRKITTTIIPKLILELEGRFPILKQFPLDEESIKRIISFGPDINKMKGQLLEELGSVKIRQALSSSEGIKSLGLSNSGEELFFIEGHRILDAKGAQITDGMIVTRQGNELKIHLVMEAKAGTAAAQGLKRSGRSIKKMKIEDKTELFVVIEEAHPDKVESLIRKGFRKDQRKVKTFIEIVNRGEIENLPEEVIDLVITNRSLRKDAARITMSEYGGQIRKDIERIYPAVDEVSTTLRLDGTKVEVTLSPTQTSFIGTLPNDVPRESILEHLKQQGFKFDIEALEISQKDLIALAEEIFKRSEK